MAPKTLAEYADLVRADLEDYNPSNRQLDFQEEFGPEAVLRALQKALDRFNTTPPPIGNYTVADFPSPSLLVDMAILALLERAAYKRTRNTLTFSDAGLSIEDQNAQAYRALVNDLRVTVRQELRALKASINMKRGFRGIPSIYRSR